jgi:hypothetical protein
MQLIWGRCAGDMPQYYVYASGHEGISSVGDNVWYLRISKMLRNRDVTILYYSRKDLGLLR